MISLSDQEFQLLADYVKANYGINLAEKKLLVANRLQHVLMEKNFNTFTDFFRYLLNDKTGEGVTTLVNRVTTNHTFFLREQEHFQFFQTRVLPELKKTAGQNDLWIWSAGCSSGEEPYTLAMLIADFFGAQKVFWDTRILATDISQKVLEAAQRGIYPQDQLTQIPQHWRKNHFRELDAERSQVVEGIRNEVIFRSFNLMNPVYPFKKRFQVIFCRNVMIYFDAATRRELVRKFYDCTEPGGYLFIGHSESIRSEDTGYQYILPAVYRKDRST